MLQHVGMVECCHPMGVKDLWQHCLEGVKKGSRKTFSQCKGETVGVDISIWLHTFCNTESVTLCMNSQPPYPPTNIIASLQNVHLSLTQHGIHPLYVFDGCWHEMKSVARANHDKQHDAAVDSLQQFYVRGRTGEVISETDRSNALKWTKTTMRPTHEIISMVIKWMSDENISFLCAPFEVEWQLVMLEKSGKIDAIMLTDGDCVILGAQRVYVDVKLNQKNMLVFEQSAVLKKVDKHLLCTYPPRLWPLVAAFLGCDYIERLTGNGPSKVFKTIIPAFLRSGMPSTATDTELFQDAFFRTTPKDAYLGNLSIRNVQFSGNTNMYVDHFWNTVSLFQHCPVLSEDRISLVPLNTFPGGHASDNNDNEWGCTIGFSKSPLSLLPLEPLLFAKAAVFDGFSFLRDDGGPLPVMPAPTYAYYTGAVDKVSDDTLLPQFGYIDVNAIPISCIPTAILQSFAAARICTYLEGTREQIEQRVLEMVNGKVPPLPPELVPKQIGNWVVSEVLAPFQKTLIVGNQFHQLVKQSFWPATSLAAEAQGLLLPVHSW